MFSTVAADGGRHAHRIYVAPGGAGKADLPPRKDGSPREPKKSSKKREGDNTVGRSVLWGDPATAPWIILCECIETGAALALAFRPEFEAGEAAVAAAISAGGVAAFQTYPTTTLFTVAADRDERAKPGKASASRRDEEAARTFGLRHHDALRVDIALPGQPGESVDWLDVLRRDGADAVRAGIDGAVPFVPTSDELTQDEARDQDGSARQFLNWPCGYRLTASGLFYAREGDEDEVRLSGPLTVLGLARDPNGNGWAVAVEWRDRDGSPHRGFVAFADLIGDGYDAFRPLVSGGLTLTHDARRLKLLKAAFSGLECGARVRLVRRSGWHDDVFVLPHVTIGHPAGELLLFEGRADVARYGQAGTLADWIEHVARPAAGNTRLVFALSLACAGPIADLPRRRGRRHASRGRIVARQEHCDHRRRQRLWRRRADRLRADLAQHWQRARGRREGPLRHAPGPVRDRRAGRPRGGRDGLSPRQRAGEGPGNARCGPEATRRVARDAAVLRRDRTRRQDRGERAAGQDRAADPDRDCRPTPAGASDCSTTPRGSRRRSSPAS